MGAWERQQIKGSGRILRRMLGRDQQAEQGEDDGSGEHSGAGGGGDLQSGLFGVKRSGVEYFITSQPKTGR